MNLIYCRTPYTIVCDKDIDQIATKIELFIWNFGETEPTTPTKVIEKTIFSPSQYANYYNISPYISDFINYLDNVAVNVKVVDYLKFTTDWVLNEEKVFVSSYGYANRNIIVGDYFALNNNIEKRYKYTDSIFNNYIPTTDVIFDFDTHDHLRVVYSSNLGSEVNDITGTGIELVRVPLSVVNPFFENGNFVYLQTFNGTSYDTFFSTQLITECEPKFNPYLLKFVNDMGGLEQMTFFKKSLKSYEVKGNDYNITPFTTYPTINPNLGQSQVFNKNGNENIKINSGWISENETELIKQIALSENLLLLDTATNYQYPMKLKTSSFQEKTNLNDKVINYEIELEFANPMINNIV